MKPWPIHATLNLLQKFGFVNKSGQHKESYSINNSDELARTAKWIISNIPLWKRLKTQHAEWRKHVWPTSDVWADSAMTMLRPTNAIISEEVTCFDWQHASRYTFHQLFSCFWSPINHMVNVVVSRNSAYCSHIGRSIIIIRSKMQSVDFWHPSKTSWKTANTQKVHSENMILVLLATSEMSENFTGYIYIVPQNCSNSVNWPKSTKTTAGPYNLSSG